MWIPALCTMRLRITDNWNWHVSCSVLWTLHFLHTDLSSVRGNEMLSSDWCQTTAPDGINRQHHGIT